MTDHGLDLERPYEEADPLDMNDARSAARRAASMRRTVEAQLRQAIDDRAAKEGAYRKLRAKAILEIKQEHGATIAKEIADGRAEVNEAFIAYRVAEGMLSAYRERLEGLEGERSMLKSLIDWSSTIANVLRQAGGMRHEPEDRRAA